MTIAITGATGHLGRLVLDELRRSRPAGSLVAVVRDAARAQDLADDGVQVRVAEYADRPALVRALAEVRVLLLVSGSEVGQRVDQHRNVIDAAVEASVQHVVYTSAPRADTSALVLAPEHRATEELLRASGLTWTILRNNWYTENYLGTLQQAAETGEIVAAAGSGRVASATRADFAAGAAAVLLGSGHEGRVYELGGDTAWDFDELAEAASAVVGRPVTYRAVDASTLRTILTEHAGLDAGTAGFVAQLDLDIAAGLLAEVTGELSALIGRPTTPLVDGLRAAYSPAVEDSPA
ncbi:MAG: SDR family oxidoreductase [Actinomycetales bacterium]|nr:SDR family oxidoreductase [Actinomycetales bacterium]